MSLFKRIIILIFKNNFSAGGFTLIELLVSTFIITLMSGIFIANYHSANSRSALTLAAQKLASDIRIAQSYSLGSLVFGVDNIPQGGWGLYAADLNNSYIIFADDNGNYNYDLGEENSSQGGKIINLPSGILIDSIIINSLPENYINLVFLPPDPIVYINSEISKNAQIRLTDGSSNKTVKVNFFGLVEVMD